MSIYDVSCLLLLSVGANALQWWYGRRIAEHHASELRAARQMARCAQTGRAMAIEARMDAEERERAARMDAEAAWLGIARWRRWVQEHRHEIHGKRSVR